jgi:hypothetical protein
LSSLLVLLLSELSSLQFSLFKLVSSNFHGLLLLSLFALVFDSLVFHFLLSLLFFHFEFVQSLLFIHILLSTVFFLSSTHFFSSFSDSLLLSLLLHFSMSLIFSLFELLESSLLCDFSSMSNFFLSLLLLHKFIFFFDLTHFELHFNKLLYFFSLFFFDLSYSFHFLIQHARFISATSSSNRARLPACSPNTAHFRCTSSCLNKQMK